jgi:glyoxylase-like metal-dependent hydrolase (beta-lactamase superfamily II)
VDALLSSGPAAPVFGPLGLQLLQRDWLSANHIVFKAGDGAPATVVDTGYARHSDLTQALIRHALAGQPLQRIVNTHLHSDHCGGNHALQAGGPLQTLVPASSWDAVHHWDEGRLTYQLTGQYCPQFTVDGILQPGSTLALGPARWQVHAAPGHDPDAILLFEPQTRTLISGDALWQDRLAIIFPELDGAPGFGPTRQTLAMIEALQPRWVIPGHGEAFEDVAGALAASRRRLDGFEAQPERHTRHAARALVMFHMMEHRERAHDALQDWLLRTPIFMTMARQLAGADGPAAWAAGLLSALVDDGWLLRDEAQLRLAGTP